MGKNSEYSWLRLLPILFGFFVMGFVDVVGIATNYVKNDFALSDTLANLIPMMVFLWFAVCSIPTGIMMSRIGRRNTVLLSMAMTAVAMIMPLLSYSFACALMAFALLGIGNTILQVSLNPMVAQVVAGDRVASVLTLGQFVKAISSFLGPVIAGVAASFFGNWKLIFAAYAVVTVLAGLWLLLSIERDTPEKEQTASFRSAVSLFTDKIILLLFIGILAIVGIDVGLNTSIPKLLMEKAGLPLSEAGLGTSLYFVAKTVGTFAGTFILAKIAGKRFMRVSMVVAIVAFVAMLFVHELWLLSVLIVVVSFACANVFSIIFSYALQHKPAKANEISALMIMGVSGGAVVMPFMGVLSDSFGQVAGLIPLLVCMVYLLWTTGKLGK